MSIVKTLTGRTRYRILTRWVKEPVLVLQVEEHATGVHYSQNDIDCRGLTVDRTYWRDASIEDMTTEKLSTQSVGEHHE